MESYWGTSEIAARLEVTGATVFKWLARYDTESRHPFPAPDVVVVERGGRETRGWHPDRWPEIERWVAERGSVQRHGPKIEHPRRN